MNKKTLVADYMDLAKERDDLKAENDLLNEKLHQADIDYYKMKAELETKNEVLRKAIEEAQAKNEAMLKSENISLAGYNSIKQILKKALEGAGKEGE